ncbi:MAG: sensor histidine kinase [Candidatus Thorarchaeota archaeon]
MRDARTTQLTVQGLVKGILGLPLTLTRPSPAVTEGGMRRRARFLRTALFAAVCVFPILQITSDSVRGYPLYSVLTIFAAGFYLLSGTQHLGIASAFTIITTACIPFVIILVYPVWNTGRLAMQILVWPVLSVLIGTQLISIKKQAVLAGGICLALVFVSVHHPGIIFREGLEIVAVYFGIAILLMFTSFNQEYFSSRLERSNRKRDSRRRELEIYTSLLKHDLGNDLQVILGGIELAQMANGEPRQSAFLESTYAAAQRMQSLLHIFSMSEDEVDADIVTLLEKIGKRAEIAFKGMVVSIKVSHQVRQRSPKYGRLVALAFENLLRNVSQHAGSNPNVAIEITQSGDSLRIRFSDDGPGIDQSIQDILFDKGVSTGPESDGLGLYLTKSIIEAERGSIELDPSKQTGCCFLIRLPLENGD